MSPIKDFRQDRCLEMKEDPLIHMVCSNWKDEVEELQKSWVFFGLYQILRARRLLVIWERQLLDVKLNGKELVKLLKHIVRVFRPLILSRCSTNGECTSYKHLKGISAVVKDFNVRVRWFCKKFFANTGGY